MAHRSLATRIWGPAAYALRRHPGCPCVPPPPPPAAAAPSRFVSTNRRQVKPQSSIKRNQQEGVSVFEKVLISIEMEELGNVAEKRLAELKEVRRQKRRAQKLYGFTLAVISCIGVYEAKMSP